MNQSIGVKTEQAVKQLILFFENFKAEDLPQLGDYYAPDAYFKDPFNEVRGIDAIVSIFDHMFTQLESPQFIIHEKVVDGLQCFIAWDFQFQFKHFQPHKRQTIRGGSHLWLDPQGKIIRHRDYWDAAEELYEKLPVMGSLIRWFKRRMHPSTAHHALQGD